MKKLLFVLALFAAPGAFAQTQGYWSQSQALTTAAPSATCPSGTTTASCGLPLGGLTMAQVCLKADAGGNLTGGTLKAYWYDPKDATWKPNASFDLTVPSTGSQYCWPAFNVFPVGRVMFVANAVTLSAGAAVTPSVRGVSK